MNKEHHELVTKLALEDLEILPPWTEEQLIRLSWLPDDWDDIEASFLKFNASSFLHFHRGYRFCDDISVRLPGAMESFVRTARGSKISFSDRMLPIIKEHGSLPSKGRITGEDVFFPPSWKVLQAIEGSPLFTQDEVASFMLHITQDNCIPHHRAGFLLGEHSELESHAQRFIEDIQVQTLQGLIEAHHILSKFDIPGWDPTTWGYYLELTMNGVIRTRMVLCAKGIVKGALLPGN